MSTIYFLITCALTHPCPDFTPACSLGVGGPARGVMQVSSILDWNMQVEADVPADVAAMGALPSTQTS